MTQQKNYKESLQLPRTPFPMKANLPGREPERLRLWKEEGLYSRIRQKSEAKPPYILHDGPPYANGAIHIGHALNKILKDIIVKYKTMRGFDAFYLPGWDCHGLPIEHQCLKEMGKRKDEVECVAFRKQARKYAEKFIAIQREEFIRLGVFGEWDHPYRTMDYDYQAVIADSFLKLFEKGYIEERLRPVPWCWDCETALAEAELEYEDKTSPSVYVAFRIAEKGVQPSDVAAEWVERQFSFLVWTTTPWTLPANVGLAFHPRLHYVFVESEKGNLVFAEELFDVVTSKLGLKDAKRRESLRGSELAGLFAIHPLIARHSKTITADYVSSIDGTGIVHIAPGHGEEDYQFGHLKNDLPILSPVDEKGRFIEEKEAVERQFVEEHSEFKGLNVFKANQKIIELLKEKGALLHQEDYPHSYPHCWRCKKPIIFRATPQWFLKIDHKINHESLRKKMEEAIANQIKFTPERGRNRMGAMVKERPDWCLSRQRYWGVPIPVIQCAKCSEIVPPKVYRDALKKLFEKEGADVWFEKSAGDFLPSDLKCAKCGAKEFKKEEDIIDVWFDSGVSHQAVLKSPHPTLSPEGRGEGVRGLSYPADLYLEGSDQHRGWFQSALTTAMALDGHPPYKGVLTHGFVVDGEGKKMSKSAGNVVAPQEVMKEFGADILRLWVASCDYSVDVRLSPAILKQLAEAYRKIRNTFRYLLGNLSDFDYKKDRVPFEKMESLDRWALGRGLKLVREVTAHYEQLEFHPIYRKVYDFCTVDLSNFYFDVLKDRLYTARREGVRRRSAQSALFYLLRNLVKILAPILPFTMDEVWRELKIEEGVPSVHEVEWPGDYPELIDEIAIQDWEDFLILREPMMKELERKREAKVIGSPLEAKVVIGTEDRALLDYLKRMENDLAYALVVSQVEIGGGRDNGVAPTNVSVTLPSDGKPHSFFLRVEKAEGGKCVRCWNYSPTVGTHGEHPDLCSKCFEALSRP